MILQCFLYHMFLEFPNNFNIGSNSWSSIFQIFSFIKQTKIFSHIHVSLLYILTLKISQDFAYKLIGASSIVTILAKTVNNSKICLLWQQQNLNSHLKYLSGDKPDLTNRGKIGTTYGLQGCPFPWKIVSYLCFTFEIPQWKFLPQLHLCDHVCLGRYTCVCVSVHTCMHRYAWL